MTSQVLDPLPRLLYGFLMKYYDVLFGDRYEPHYIHLIRVSPRLSFLGSP